jgi:hypothetical protein
MNLGTDWFNFNFLGNDPAKSGATQNGDGSVAISGAGGDNAYNAQIGSAFAGSTPTNWTGEAFGGGGYFQATLSWTGSYSGSGGWPSFWANAVENMAGTDTSKTDHIELDAVEFWGQNLCGYLGSDQGRHYETHCGRLERKMKTSPV